MPFTEVGKQDRNSQDDEDFGFDVSSLSLGGFARGGGGMSGDSEILKVRTLQTVGDVRCFGGNLELWFALNLVAAKLRRGWFRERRDGARVPFC